MKTLQSAMMMCLFASALMSGSCAIQEGGAPMSGSISTAAPSTSVGGSENGASGSQGDTLQACIARIPRDASAGLRMIAEQSCERDEANRKAILSVPGAQ